MAGGTINNSFEEHIHYGEIKIMDNAVETVINGSTEWQGITSNAVTGLVKDFTFDSGGVGTIRSLDLNIHRL